MPTGAGIAAVLLLLVVVALWATGGNGSMSYYQREVERMMRKQSRQEKADMADRNRRRGLRRWGNRANPTRMCRWRRRSRDGA